jgi:hypothetical protein
MAKKSLFISSDRLIDERLGRVLFLLDPTPSLPASNSQVTISHSGKVLPSHVAEKELHD